jgi:hypothetical protein
MTPRAGIAFFIALAALLIAVLVTLSFDASAQASAQPNWAEVLAAIASLISAIAALGALIGVIVGATIAIGQTREAVQTRHAALMSELSKRWDEPLMVVSRQLGVSYPPERLRQRIEYLEGTREEELYVLERTPNFLEDIAVLEARGAIPFDMLRQSLGGTLVTYWDHWKPAATYMRGDQKYDLVYENFEGLAERMRAYLKEHAEVPGVD